MFAYRLVSGHWRVQTGVAGIGEAGTVTTAGVYGPNVLTGWEQRRPEWVDVAWLAMRVHVGRQRKMGVGVDVIDVEEDEPPPTRKRKGRPEGDTGPTPPPKAGGAGGGAGAEGGGAGVGGPAAGGGMGGTRHQRGGRQPRPRGPSVQGQRGQAGRRVAVGGRHQGA